MTQYDPALLWAVVLAAGLGTVALKTSFVLAAGWMDGVPPRVGWILAFVPAAVLAGLVAPAVLVPSGSLTLAGWPRLVAAAVAAAVAWRTENVAATIAVGMAALWTLRWLAGGL